MSNKFPGEADLLIQRLIIENLWCRQRSYGSCSKNTWVQVPALPRMYYNIEHDVA